MLGGASFGDNVKAKFGASDDLQIWHNSTGGYSIIRDAGAGDLYIEGSANIRLRDPDGRQSATFVPNGSQTFYNANSVKLATTSTGIDVTGSVTCDGFTSTGIDDNATSTAITIDASENVGIGTASPAGILHLDEGAADDCRLIAETHAGGDSMILFTQGASGAGTPTWGIGLDATNDVLSIGFEDTGYNDFSLTADSKFVIDNSGNVGIGTSSPDQTLHVHKASAGTVSSSSNSVLTLENSTTAILQFLTPNTSNAQIRFGDPQDNGIGYIQYNHTDNALQFGTNGPEKMRITSAGNVGIGTSSVSQLLHLSSASPRIQIDNTAGAVSYIDAATNGTLEFVADDTNAVANSSMRFKVDGTERMRITSAGSVGIGTTSPTAKLDVNGTLTCDGFTSTGIDDNATSTAITISASENVTFAGNVLVDNDSGVATALTVNGTQSFVYLKEDDVADKHTRFMQSGGSFYVSTVNDSDALVSTSLSINNATNNVTVSTGNLVIGTSGKGIDFSANGNAAGMTSEVLDDYEEGTWTPELRGTGSGSTIATPTSNSGYYTKVGRLVTVTADARTSSLNGITGNAQIHGLPFPIKNVNGAYCGMSAGYGSSHANTNGAVSGFGSYGTAYIPLTVHSSNGNTTYMTTAEWGNAGRSMITLTYQTE